MPRGEEGDGFLIMRNRRRILPFTITLVLQLVLPAGFWASRIKSPLSSVPRPFIWMTATESMNVIWYLSLAVSSCSFLYHTTRISGETVILHSRRVESPAFTILDASNFFTNFGGSKESEKRRSWKKCEKSQKPNWVVDRKGRHRTKVWENYSAMLESCIVTESRNNRGTSQTETSDNQTCTPVTSKIVLE